MPARTRDARCSSGRSSGAEVYQLGRVMSAATSALLRGGGLAKASVISVRRPTLLASKHNALKLAVTQIGAGLALERLDVLLHVRHSVAHEVSWVQPP